MRYAVVTPVVLFVVITVGYSEARAANRRKRTTTSPSTTPAPSIISIDDTFPLILDGIEAVPGAWPFLISLQLYDDFYGEYNHICGAVLIDPQFALTAAHCVDNRVRPGAGYPSNLRLALAEHDLSSDNNEEYIGVTAIRSHQSFELDITKGNPNDISVLKLARQASVSRSDIAVIALPNAADTFVNSPCFILGWGFTSPQGSYNADKLQQASVPSLSNSACSQAAVYPILSTTICAGGNGQPLPCNGDSGGPLVCTKNGQKLVVGIASWTYLCNQQHPAVFTRVTSYLSWIATQKI